MCGVESPSGASPDNDGLLWDGSLFSSGKWDSEDIDRSRAQRCPQKVIVPRFVVRAWSCAHNNTRIAEYICNPSEYVQEENVVSLARIHEVVLHWSKHCASSWKKPSDPVPPSALT
jgi:hypothetical protein